MDVDNNGLKRNKSVDSMSALMDIPEETNTNEVNIPRDFNSSIRQNVVSPLHPTIIPPPTILNVKIEEKEVIKKYHENNDDSNEKKDRVLASFNEIKIEIEKYINTNQKKDLSNALQKYIAVYININSF